MNAGWNERWATVEWDTKTYFPWNGRGGYIFRDLDVKDSFIFFISEGHKMFLVQSLEQKMNTGLENNQHVSWRWLNKNVPTSNAAARSAALNYDALPPPLESVLHVMGSAVGIGVNVTCNIKLHFQNKAGHVLLHVMTFGLLRYVSNRGKPSNLTCRLLFMWAAVQCDQETGRYIALNLYKGYRRASGATHHFQKLLNNFNNFESLQTSWHVVMVGNCETVPHRLSLSNQVQPVSFGGVQKVEVLFCWLSYRRRSYFLLP